MSVLIEKLLELYRTESITMLQLNAIVALIVYLIISIIEEKNNHIARQLGAKMKKVRKSRNIKLELDLENGILSGVAKKIEKKVETKLENANIDFSPKEFSFFFIGGMLAGAAIGFIFFPFLFYNILGTMMGAFTSAMVARVLSTLLFGAIGTAIPFIVVKVKIKRRKTLLADQLIDFIMSLADGLKTSSTTQEAIRVVAQEMPSPISDELQRLVGELEYAVPFEDALENLKRRIDLPEYTLVINAMQIQSRTGSHLEKMLRSMAKVSEERRETREEVLKIVRQTKSTAYILLAAPFVLGGGMFLMMPDMALPAYSSGLGMIVLGVVAVVYVVTIFIIREIDKFVAKSL